MFLKTLAFPLVIRIPELCYAKKMREKSKGLVLAVDMNDPSTTRGVTEVLKNLVPYLASLTEDGNVRQKIIVNGWYL